MHIFKENKKCPIFRNSQICICMFAWIPTEYGIILILGSTQICYFYWPIQVK